MTKYEIRCFIDPITYARHIEAGSYSEAMQKAKRYAEITGLRYHRTVTGIEANVIG